MLMEPLSSPWQSSATAERCRRMRYSSCSWAKDLLSGSSLPLCLDNSSKLLSALCLVSPWLDEDSRLVRCFSLERAMAVDMMMKFDGEIVFSF